MRTVDKKIDSHARDVWQVMQREAKSRGMALTKQTVPASRRPLDGRVIIATIGAFIKALNKERGWGLDENQIDLTRRYLRETGNVIALEKVEKYRFRIFVAEEWNEVSELIQKQIREPDAIDKRAAKLDPKDVGEDRDPAPVEVAWVCHCGAGPFKSQHALNGHKASHNRGKTKKEKQSAGITDPLRNKVTEDLNVRQAKMLVALAAYGGEIYDKDGKTSPIWAKLAGETRTYVSHAMKSMVERDYVTVERSSPKAKNTKRVTMTEKAWQIVNMLGQEWKSQRKESISDKSGTYPVWSETEEGWNIDPGPSFRSPVDPKPDTAESLGSVADFSDSELINELKLRLTRPNVDEKKMASLEERLELIQSLVEEVNDGKCSPLKALADIQEAVTL